MNSQFVLDIETWNKWRDIDASGNSGFWQNLLETFMTAAPDQFKAVEQAFAKLDLPQIVFTAHSLRSSCRNLGAQFLDAELLKIEQAAKKRDVPFDKTLTPEIRAAFESAVMQISEELEKVKKATTAA